MDVAQIRLLLTQRKIRRQARHILKSARHIHNLREDVAAPADIKRLLDLMKLLSDGLQSGDLQVVEQLSRQLAEVIQKVNPPRSYSFLRENIEVIVVALAVAMAFRTYFVQPFKIPTSSMCPTLAGIHYIEKDQKALSDYFPFNIVKWAIFGQMYKEVKAQATGTVSITPTRRGVRIDVGGIVHKIHPNMSLRVAQNDTVLRGQALASAMKVAGDHIFVNKLKWNFVKPVRSEIMVFKTDGIVHPQISQNVHYVKRMVGLPGESIGVNTPLLYINGRPLTGNGMIDKIQSCSDGYNGYIQSGILTGGVNAVKLTEDQYFACGDNQRNSLDSRYWGPVPRGNLVGPAFFVYWPVSVNWGPVK